ncbi:MAG: prohibitin family protein [Fibrobacteria bacterium]|nr:prohibitin family protein [Fibrobacteria bacterium]
MAGPIPNKPPVSLPKLIGLAFAAVVGFSFLRGAVYTVDSGERGIVLTWGAITSIVDDGLHLKVPFMQVVRIVDVRTRKAHAPAQAASSDMQRVQTEVALNYHLDPEKLHEIYTKTGLVVEGSLIDPRIQEVVKAVVAKYQADKLLMQREQVKAEIESLLKTSLVPYHVIVEAVQITNFKFSEQYDAAIEAKQTAEQNAQKAKNDLERIKVEAEQKIATAQAEAEAIRIQSEAIKAQGGAGYVQLKAIEKWNGQLPTYTGSGPLPFLQVGSK